jgi:hypothetical protein
VESNEPPYSRATSHDVDAEAILALASAHDVTFDPAAPIA